MLKNFHTPEDFVILMKESFVQGSIFNGQNDQ